MDSNAHGAGPHEFLAAILPDSGYLCALVKGKHNKFFATVEDLADFIVAQDALGETVYHACASFRAPRNDPRDTPRAQRVLGRTKANAVAARAFWLDVDAGEGKPYVDAADAAEAVARFVQSTGLPAPVYVGSGMGLHVYWPLDEDLDRETWERYAAGLKSLCQRHGLEAGPERTADISSILRTPGTHWRKHGGAKLVQAGPIQGPYSIEEFKDVGTNTGGLARTQSLPAPRPERRQSARPESLIAAALNVYRDDPASAYTIAGSCRQLAEFAERSGQISEPHWYAAIGVLTACDDGAAFAHAYGAGHAGYSFAETNERLDRAREFGPTTCSKFESVNHRGCEGCVFRGRITSPIQLGRANEIRIPQVAVDERPERHESSLAPVGRLDFPDGFVRHDNSLCFQTEKNGGIETLRLISKHPPLLARVQTGEIEDNNYSLVFELKLPRSGAREIVLPAKTFFGANGISEISGQGAIIHDHDLYKKYVREAVDNWHTMNNLSKQYDQFGWKTNDTEFLFGKNLYSAIKITPVMGSSEVQHRAQYLGPVPGGSLARWTGAANGLFAKGLEPQSFALLCAFAAPLMRFHAAGEGGAIVSLVSDQSGSGKTTALEAVASVWGRVKGTQLTDEDTKVAKGLKLGVFGNLACTYDELHNRDPEIIRQFVLMFTSGHDKDRGTSGGQLIHTKAEWQTILTVASNQSLVDVLSNMDGTDAPAFRVLEFNATLPDGVDSKRGDSIRRELAANSGFAGDAFLRYLLQPDVLAYVKSALPAWTDQIWARTGLKSEHRFWVRTIASVIAAGTIVQKTGILDFSMQRMADWAIDQVSTRQKESTVTRIRNESNLLSEFINEHLQEMLVMPTAWKPKTSVRPLVTPKGKLTMRYEMAEGRLFILESHLRKWLLKRGAHRKVFLEALQEREVLVTDHKRVTLGAGSDFASGQITAIEINMSHPLMSGLAMDVEKLAIREKSA